MTKKRSGPGAVGGSGGLGKLEEAGKTSSARRIAQKARRGPDRARRPRAKVWWLTKGQLRRCAVARRWPNSSVLFGEGDYAVVSHCHDRGPEGAILVSLHPTRARAEEVKRELDERGCSQDWSLCRSEHEVIDLRAGFESLCEHLVKVREYWRAVR
jgi:hypothetical protein